MRTAGLAWAGILFAWRLAAQSQPPIVPENSVTRVSDHVHAILAFPNIAIVAGERGALVVDTGMGPRNGATVAREAEKLAPGRVLYLTTTHFHPEHAGGVQGFPARTILIRTAVQQEEMNQRGEQFLEMFRKRSDLHRELLEGVKLRPPDIVFGREVKVDLGGVTARVMWMGAAHTRGDELIFVEPDGVLISGDIVQNKIVPGMPNEDARFDSWLAILDKLEPLKPRAIVPDHGALGDGSLISSQRAFMKDLQSRAAALKKQGTPVEEAGKTLGAEFKEKYSGWTNLNNVANAVRRIYAETP
jgi:glyoxylase-like metal-dependent hydrolase (beta-lactamase superfamily II)